MSQALLNELYRNVWPSFAALPTDQGLSLPLFISLNHSSWNAKLKLLVIGQETFSWYGFLGHQELGADPVETVLANYAQFKLGERYNSPFWFETRRLRRLLEADGEQVGLAWSNLYPCDQRKRRPIEPLGQSLLALKVLPSEIKILKPDAVVFFTGRSHYYNEALKFFFNGVQTHDAGVPAGQWIQRIEHDDLPVATFRTYHPGYLRRKKKGATINTLAALIKTTSRTTT